MSILDDVRAFNQKFRGDPEKRTRPIRQTGGDASVMEEVMNRPVAGGTTNLFQGANLPGGAGDTGSAALSFANPGGMPGVDVAQQFLGNDTYNQAIAAGMTPEQIDSQLQRALAEGRGVNVGKFQEDLDKFQQFQESDFAKGLSNTLPVIDDENVFSVSPLQITANPPEGVMGLLGAIGGPFVDMIGDVAKAGAEGRIGAMNLIRDFSDKVGEKVGELTNPNDIRARLDAAGPEAKRIYALKLSQGVPFQQAFEEATGQKFATGGIATLQ